MKLIKYDVAKNGEFLELIKEEAKIYKDIDGEISEPVHVLKVMKKIEIHKKAEEHLYLICLNSKNKIKGIFLVAKGSLNAMLYHPREIFKRAIFCNANSIIMVHNHPSGDTTPSKEDFEMTHRLKEAGKLLGISLLDSIIIGEENSLYSFKRETNL